MHAPRPYGLQVIGKELTGDDENFIASIAARVSNLKSVSGVDSLKMVYDLPDGGYVIVQDMGGNFRVIAHKPVENQEKLYDGLAKKYIPMLFSGALDGQGLIRQDQPLPLILTLQTRKRLMGYTGALAPRNVRLKRFAIGYGPRFQEFMPQGMIRSNLLYTQYMQQRATWYSGAMSEVMQIVGGYGKQIMSNLPDDLIERAQLQIPESFRQRIDDAIKNVRLPAYSGLPNEDGQYQYDYKFNHTNLTAFDDNNEPWLLKVDASGVWAMPLPIIPATATEAFREFVEYIDDQELLLIIDRFGAMPSGESFPIGKAFQAWRRAGVIIKVCDVKDFYNYQSFTTACGWSANTRGTEIVNTCFDTDWTTGEIIAMTFKGRLRLGRAISRGWVRGVSGIPDNDLPAASAYLNFIYEKTQEPIAENIAIKYKLAAAPTDILLSRLRNKLDDNEVYFWNNLELAPIADHSGNITLIDKGGYYGGQNIKLPEPIFGGCISLPTPPPFSASNTLKKDTIVLAYYIGDQLKTVKLFADLREQKTEVDTNFETYMYVGQWFKNELIGGGKIAGSVYLTDKDDRFITAPTIRETSIEGRDLGFGGAILQMDYYWWRTGSLFRYRYYTTKTNVKTTYDKSIRQAATIPYFFRNAVIYGKTDYAASASEKETFKRGRVGDPHRYRIWSDNESLLMFGGLEVQRGKPYPVDGKPVYAEILEYSPNESNDFANDGDWVGDLPADVTPLLYNYQNVIWAFRNEHPEPPVNEYERSSETKNPSKKELYAQVFDRMDFVSDNYSDEYHWRTPDEYMNVLQRDGCKVTFGDTHYANISEETMTGNRKQWGFSAVANNRAAHCFIGVINE